jgi:hypothetical protein
MQSRRVEGTKDTKIDPWWGSEHVQLVFLAEVTILNTTRSTLQDIAAQFLGSNKRVILILLTFSPQ